MVNPHRIKYAGVSSDELNMIDLIMDVAFDSDNGETSSFLSRSAVQSESHDGRYKPTTRYKYDENFAPKFTFTKQDFSDFSLDEVRIILKYLTSKDTTALLEVFYDDSNVVAWAAIGGWTEINLQKLANNRTVGITAVFSAVHPFALSDVYKVKLYPASYEDATVHYWEAAYVSGNTTPTYFITDERDIRVGTKMYSVSSEITESIVNVPMTLYSAVYEINDSGYKLKDAVITLTYIGSRTKRTYGNKVTIHVDTDDNKPIYPRITVNHGYSEVSTPTPHIVVPLPTHVTFDNIADMAGYVENTIYHNDIANEYYYKAYTPSFTSSTTLPDYAGWQIEEVDRPYTSEDTFAANKFYYYEYDNMYYWKFGRTFYEEPSLPVYGDWVVREVDRVYTSADAFEDKTIYHYNNTYYWMAPHSFYKSSEQPGISTTSVKIVNQYYDVFNTSNHTVETIVKNNSPTERIVMDGTNKLIFSNNTRRIIGDDFVNWQWLELYDGKNEVTIEGNCEVTLEWREVRKVGEY